MTSSQSSVHGENGDKPDALVTRAKVQQMGNNILQAHAFRLPMVGWFSQRLLIPWMRLWMHIRLMMMPMTDSVAPSNGRDHLLEHEEKLLAGEALPPVLTLAVVLSTMVITIRRNMVIMMIFLQRIICSSDIPILAEVWSLAMEATIMVDMIMMARIILLGAKLSVPKFT
uniref:Uncharacterized protein n=1 Tax=Oryza punctata TaxID=4537 RepID=A0A0E0LTC7_ORYPU